MQFPPTDYFKHTLTALVVVRVKFSTAVDALAKTIIMLLLTFDPSIGLPVSNDDTDSNKSTSSRSDNQPFSLPLFVLTGKGKQLPKVTIAL